MSDSVAAVVVAAGRGLRAGGETPKQYRKLLGEPVVRGKPRILARHPAVAAVQPVIHPDDAALYRTSRRLGSICGRRSQAAQPGKLRCAPASRRWCRCALTSCWCTTRARPFASPALVARAIAAAQASGAAVPAVAVADTVKSVDAQGRVTGTIDRTHLRLVQTPQAFRFATLLDAHRRAAAAGRDDFTDDAALAEWAGLAVATFEGEAENVKLTTDDRFHPRRGGAARGAERRAHRLRHRRPPVRRRRPRHAGRRAHSPRARAIRSFRCRRGAACAGRCHPRRAGRRRYRRAFSARRSAMARGLLRPLSRLCARAPARARRMHRPSRRDRGLRGAADRPAPRSDPARIAEIAGIAIERVGVKATTSESMGFTGRGEGMAAFANATIRLPGSGP